MIYSFFFFILIEALGLMKRDPIYVEAKKCFAGKVKYVIAISIGFMTYCLYQRLNNIKIMNLKVIELVT